LNEKWCGDITYVQVGGMWLHLACAIGICSRRVLGWSMAYPMRSELVIDALEMAVATRGGHVDGLIFNADKGSQYTSALFAQVCDGFGIRRSTGWVGSNYDSALAESFWQGLKRDDAPEAVLNDASGKAGDLPVADLLQLPTASQCFQLPLASRVRTTAPART
jgi:transposase InsO family protein